MFKKQRRQLVSEPAISLPMYKRTPKYYMAGPLRPDLLMTLVQVHKDLEVMDQLYHVGAPFEALYMGILMAASDLGCIFFFESYPMEQNNVVITAKPLAVIVAWVKKPNDPA